MSKAIAVRFRRSGNVQYYDPGELELTRGMHVIVRTGRGVEYGEVALSAEDVKDSLVEDGELTGIMRIATAEDEEKYQENLEKEKEAFKICEKKIQQHELEMKLAGVDITFDNNKTVFYFTADGRVDFRELVKDLASVFRTRIELRQIGVRDETKIVGGLGTCGRELCCSCYLNDFAPVTIKMAKDQGLSLNPSKISGACGRLMCCLRNEEETYEHLNSIMPRVGDTVETSEGETGDVTNVNILRQIVKVVVEVDGEKEERVLSADDITVIGHNKKKKNKPEQKPEKSDEDVEEQISGAAFEDSAKDKPGDNSGDGGFEGNKEQGYKKGRRTPEERDRNFRPNRKKSDHGNRDRRQNRDNRGKNNKYGKNNRNSKNHNKNTDKRPH